MEVSVAKKSKLSFDPKKFLGKVGEGKAIAKYQKDQIVFSQGDTADAVFYVQKGKLKLTVISEQGKEAVIAILGPGHFFGEGCLNGHALRVATTTAMDDCVITRIAKASMIATLHGEPEFSELFISYLLARNSRIEEDLVDQLFNSSEKRLARLLPSPRSPPMMHLSADLRPAPPDTLCEGANYRATCGAGSPTVKGGGD
jgi:CRP/FNR family cyclic AMP-dependent transcriptional regulator